MESCCPLACLSMSAMAHSIVRFMDYRKDEGQSQGFWFFEVRRAERGEDMIVYARLGAQRKVSPFSLQCAPDFLKRNSIVISGQLHPKPNFSGGIRMMRHWIAGYRLAN